MPSQHGVLQAGVVATVVMEGLYSSVEVMNRDGTAEIYYWVDQAGNPTVGGANTEALPAAICARKSGSPSPALTTVKLISDGTPAYSVMTVG